MKPENKIKKATDLMESIAANEKTLADLKAQLDQLKPQVDSAIEQIAAKFLTDDQGQPRDGVVYWYRYQGLVRHGDFLGILPLTTTDLDKFEFSNGAAPVAEELVAEMPEVL